MSKKNINLNEFTVPEKITKGKVISIGDTEVVKTQFGDSLRIIVNVEINKQVYPVSLVTSGKVLDRQIIHPRSNLYKILSKYNCKKITDLVGKEVELELNAKGFYRII
jgi:biotin synthase-related radical SAM superfamily protein